MDNILYEKSYLLGMVKLSKKNDNARRVGIRQGRRKQVSLPLLLVLVIGIYIGIGIVSKLVLVSVLELGLVLEAVMVLILVKLQVEKIFVTSQHLFYIKHFCLILISCEVYVILLSGCHSSLRYLCYFWFFLVLAVFSFGSF